jgi:tetratricopeptide (TPR) repeat protein
MLEPLLASPPEDAATYVQALWSYSWALTAMGRAEESIAPSNRALEVAPDDASRVMALTMRALACTFLGEHDAAIRDNEEATALARRLDGGTLYFALSLESQARLFAGQQDRALELLATAVPIGEAADAEFLWRRHTVYGDHAALSGRPREALDHYAQSLEEAQLRGNEMQALFDLIGVASALAALGADEDALEVAAMADTQMTELGIPTATAVHLLGQEEHVPAAERVGPKRAKQAKLRGGAVPAARRVARACEIARARAAAGLHTTLS